MSSARDMFGGPELYQLQHQVGELQAELATAKENARFEHKRWFEEFQRNDDLVHRNARLSQDVDELRAEILAARKCGRLPELIWETP